MGMNQQGFPNISAPLVNPQGYIQQTWFQLLINLWNRTGGGPGGPASVENGGTGRQYLDNHSVIIGEGSDPVGFASSDVAGKFLGSTGPDTDPTFQTVTIDAADLTGTTLASNVINSSLSSVGTLISGIWNATLIAVGFGGTGTNTLNDHEVLIGSGTDPISTVSPGTSGLVLMSNGTSADPTFQSLPASSIAWTQIGSTYVPVGTETVVTFSGFSTKSDLLMIFSTIGQTDVTSRRWRFAIQQTTGSTWSNYEAVSDVLASGSTIDGAVMVSGASLNFSSVQAHAVPSAAAPNLYGDDEPVADQNLLASHTGGVSGIRCDFQGFTFASGGMLALYGR